MKKIWEIYTLRENNVYLNGEEEEHDKLDPFLFAGESLKDVWDSSFELDFDEERSTAESSDVPRYAGYFFVVNEKALKVFMKMASDDLECLDFKCGCGKYVILNLLGDVDCLDMEKSEYKVYKGTPDIIQTYKKLCFRYEALQGKHLFRVRHCDYFIWMCSDEFKQAIEEAKITGIGFKEIPQGE